MTAAGRDAPGDWFAEWFDRDYLLVYGHRDSRDAARAVDLLRRLAEPAAGDRVLDLACGPGRHAVQLAAHGLRVVGLDLSPWLLAEAARVSDLDAGTGRLALVRGDMRALPFAAASFDLVASFFTSFGYFDDDGNRQALADAARVLAPQGALLLDGMNPAHVLASLPPERSRRLGSTYVIESYRHDPLAKRLIKSIEIQELSETRRRFESVRLYAYTELAAMLASVGLRVGSACGDYDGAPFDETRSPRLIVLARRPAVAS